MASIFLILIEEFQTQIEGPFIITHFSYMRTFRVLVDIPWAQDIFVFGKILNKMCKLFQRNVWYAKKIRERQSRPEGTFNH